MNDVMELHDGRWRPAVPLPFFAFLHVRCHCGRRFWHLQRGLRCERYEEHFRGRHIDWTPQGPCLPMA